MKGISRFLPLAALLASSGAWAIKVQSGDDFNLNVNVLLQVRAEGTFQGSVNKQFDTDFFLRRARLMATGTAYKNFNFLIQLDNSNLGKRGNITPGAFVQDLILGWTPIEDFTIEGGLLLMPTTRMGSYSASGGQLVIEAPIDLLLLNADKGFRENGVEIRGFLVNKLIHYRAGVWEGLHSAAVPPVVSTAAVTTAGAFNVNPGGRPLVGGHLRVNLIGNETGYAFNQMYLDGKPRASVGGTIQYQPQAACVAPGVTPSAANCSFKSNGTVNDYLMYAGDAFIDWPLPGDQEFAADAAVYRWDYGSNAGTSFGTPATTSGFTRTGLGYAGTVSYRVGPVGIAASGYQFLADSGTTNKGTDRRKLAATLTWFLKGNLSKVQAEVNSFTPGSTGPASVAPTPNAGGITGPATTSIWLQAQASF